jgi:hypothetical protein
MTMTTTRLGSYVISMDEKSSLCFLDPRTLWYICKITYRLFRTLKDCLEFCHSIWCTMLEKKTNKRPCFLKIVDGDGEDVIPNHPCMYQRIINYKTTYQLLLSVPYFRKCHFLKSIFFVCDYESFKFHRWDDKKVCVSSMILVKTFVPLLPQRPASVVFDSLSVLDDPQVLLPHLYGWTSWILQRCHENSVHSCPLLILVLP